MATVDFGGGGGDKSEDEAEDVKMMKRP